MSDKIKEISNYQRRGYISKDICISDLCPGASIEDVNKLITLVLKEAEKGVKFLSEDDDEIRLNWYNIKDEEKNPLRTIGRYQFIRTNRKQS